MIKALSYVGFSSPNATDWLTFGPDMLGLEASESEGTVKLRLDDAPWRISVAPGEHNNLEYVGWDAGDAAAVAAARNKLTAAGIDVHDGDQALADARAVDEVIYFNDPFGFHHEITHGRAVSDTPFTPGHGISGFVTGDGGMGHLVMMVPNMQQATEFYQGLLGFRHSDDIEVGFTIRFFHCNPRHHTLALSEIPGHRGVHHLMLEVEHIDDVGLAYDRVNEAGLPLAMTLGRHPNDEMTSFYVRTPSGFEIEFGCGGRLINMEEEWPVGEYDAMSIWGHKPPAEPLAPGIIAPIETPN